MKSWEQPRRARMEMVPLMDCMFLLLTFFIYYAASASNAARITVQMPEAETAEKGTDEEGLLRIIIDSDGTLLVDEKQVSLEALSGKLKEWVPEHPAGEIRVAADERVPYGVPLRVLDTVRAAGGEKVGLETSVKEIPEEKTGGR